MALFEDVLKGGNITTGLAVGLGMAVLTPLVMPVLRPVAKSVLKAGLMAYDGGRAALSAVGHEAEGVVFEARSEMGARQPRSGGSAKKSPSATAAKRTRRK